MEIELWEKEDRKDHEETAKPQYKIALRKLAEAFTELELRAGLHEGLHAHEQRTRPCPCGAGQLARWPWALQPASLGFCPGRGSFGKLPHLWPAQLGKALLGTGVDRAMTRGREP